MRIDLHILALPERKDTLDRAVQSVPRDLFNLRVIPSSLEEPLGKTRMQALSLGTSEYCTFLNDDDELISEGAYKVVEDLRAHPAAVGVFSDELVIVDSTGEVKPGRSTGTGPWDPMLMFRYPSYGHQLIIIKKSVLNRHAAMASVWGCLSEYVLRCLAMQDGAWIHSPYDAYKWHIHDSNNHKLISHRQRLEASKFVLPVLNYCKYLPQVN